MVAKKSDKKEKKATLKVKSWYSNRYQLVVVQRNILLLLTMVSMFSVVVAVLFVRHVMSAKSLEPYVIEVEKKTGIATVVDQTTTQRFTGDQMVRRFFINKYLHAFIGYDHKTYEDEREVVRLLSTRDINSQYRARINPRVLGDFSKINVRINSIQFLDFNTAKIRLVQQKIVKDREERTNLVVDMKFHYSPNMNLSMEDRLINPLGFQVTQFLITDEIFEF
jgi:type IV secretion system protein VirB8